MNKISLADEYPELIKDWSNKNLLSPQNYAPHSNKKILWQCSKCNYEWLTKIGHRTGKNKSGCPNCYRIVQAEKQKIPKQGHSLLDKFPEICTEWSNLNNILPQNCNPAASYKVWWKCNKCQYEWQDSISHRTTGNRGCIKCHKSKGETIIDKFLHQNNILSYSQVVLTGCKYKQNLKFDFIILYKNKLAAIEYNGEQHYKICTGYFSCIKKLKLRQIRDNIKVKFCNNKNIPLLIISYLDIDNINYILNNFILSL